MNAEQKGVILVSNNDGDWMGLYLGDDLVYEGHSISPGRMLEILGITHTNFADFDMGDAQRFPRTRSVFLSNTWQ